MKLRAGKVRLDEGTFVEIYDLSHDGVRLALLSFDETVEFLAHLIVILNRREGLELVERAGDTGLGEAIQKELDR